MTRPRHSISTSHALWIAGCTFLSWLQANRALRSSSYARAKASIRSRRLAGRLMAVPELTLSPHGRSSHSAQPHEAQQHLVGLV